MTTLYSKTHPFIGTGAQCEHIVSDYIGPCGCVKSNPIHLNGGLIGVEETFCVTKEEARKR